MSLWTTRSLFGQCTRPDQVKQSGLGIVWPSSELQRVVASVPRPSAFVVSGGQLQETSVVVDSTVLELESEALVVDLCHERLDENAIEWDSFPNVIRARFSAVEEHRWPWIPKQVWRNRV